jgi:Protein of unknown function (DUF3551)
LEKIMKTIHKLAMASAVAFSAFAFVALAGAPAEAGPIVPPGHACLQNDLGGTDCSFTSYSQCLATAQARDAECYGGPVGDDQGSRFQGRGAYEARAQARR